MHDHIDDKDDKDDKRVRKYVITNDSSINNERNHVTPEIQRILEELTPDVEKGRKYVIKKLNRLCLKYPRVPVFKNLLSSAYLLNNNQKQAGEVNNWLIKEHPDYLYGKINQAAELLMKGKPEEIPEILGASMELGDLYPDREVFHVEEVLNFFYMSIEYF